MTSGFAFAFLGVDAGVQYLLSGAVVLGVVVNQPAFFDLFEHADITESLKLFVGGSDDEAHGSARNETVREMVSAVRERHTERADRVHVPTPG